MRFCAILNIKFRRRDNMKRLKDFIVRTKLDNTTWHKKLLFKSSFATNDYVFLESEEELEALSEAEREAKPTYYASMLSSGELDGYLTRDAIGGSYLQMAKFDGSDEGSVENLRTAKYAICPAMSLDTASIISERKKSNNFKIESVKDENGKIIYHTIEFGAYPQDKAENSEEIWKLFHGGKLKETGKVYPPVNYDEVEYNGEKYVKDLRSDDWIKIQPIKWKIRNWDELPKEINPDGTGTAKTIRVRSEKAIMSNLPFKAGPKYGDDIDLSSFGFKPNPLSPKTLVRKIKNSKYKKYNRRAMLWQNSIMRAYLNGYDLHKELQNGNGNKHYMFEKNYDFEGEGFFNKVFDNPLTQNQYMKQKKEDKKQTEQLQTSKQNLEKQNNTPQEEMVK